MTPVSDLVFETLHSTATEIFTGALAACSVIVENVVAFTVAQALVEKFGGDSLTEMRARYNTFLELARAR